MKYQDKPNAELEAKWLSKLMVANSHHAFTELVKIHQSQIRNYARRLTKGDFCLADDIAQDTFIIAYEKIQTFTNKGSFVGWLLKICYHQFLAHLRKNKFDISDYDYESAVNDMTETEIMLQQAIAVLSPEERSAVTLHCTFGYSHQEITQIMVIPLGTVKSHINRGKIKMTEYIQNQQTSVKPYSHNRGAA